MLTPFYSLETGTFVATGSQGSAASFSAANTAAAFSAGAIAASAVAASAAGGGGGGGGGGGYGSESSGGGGSATGSQPHTSSIVISRNGSANASSSSLHNLHINNNNNLHMRGSASSSHLLLSHAGGASGSGGGGGGGGQGGREGSGGSAAPLVAHFSLAGITKYNGQPRRHRSELAMVTEKLREMQYEVSRLHRKIREYEEDMEQWSLRYSRRVVILSNIALGGWIFLLQFMEGMRSRNVRDSWINRLFIPSGVFAAARAARGAASIGGAAAAGLGGAAAAAAGNSAAAAAAAKAGVSAAALSAAASAAAAAAAKSATPLSAVLISGFLTGVQSSLPFLLSAVLQVRTQSWKRNTGFLLSTAYSLYLVIMRRKNFRPAAANYINILANLFYVAARYYFLHGLLVFNSMRIL